MSNATIVKVTVDTPCTMTVSSVSEAQGQFGPQIRLEGTDGNGLVTVFEKLERADEQLRRAGLDRQSVVGKTITLHKENVTSNGKTFPALRISVVGGSSAPAKSNGAAKQPISIGNAPWEQEETGAPPKAMAATTTDKLAEKFALYDRCFTYAYQCAKGAGITDQQAIASMAATIFIQASR